jgi:hypothetical protein
VTKCWTQGLVPDLIFPVPVPDSYFLGHFLRRIFTQFRAFYPAYQLVYMTGAFCGRSSINVFRLPAPPIWMYFPVLLGALFFLALLWEALSMTARGDAFGLFATICVIFCGGIAEGLAYGNSYWRVSREDLPESLEKRYSVLSNQQLEDETSYFNYKEAKGTQPADPEVKLREFLIASIAASDVAGILLASVIASFVSPAVCQHQVANGRNLCRKRVL